MAKGRRRKKVLFDYWYLEDKGGEVQSEVLKECENFVNSLDKKQYEFFDTIFSAMSCADIDKFAEFVKMMSFAKDERLSREVDEFFASLDK